MAIKIYKSREFDHTHERILFDELTKNYLKNIITKMINIFYSQFACRWT